MYLITTVDEHNNTHTSSVPVPEAHLVGLVQHLMSSPLVHDVQVEQMEDLACLHGDMADVIDTWVDRSIDACVQDIDALILGK